MLSSYAVSVLVLHLFNKYTAGLDHPFSVLRSFLHTYMEYPWETHVLTLQGPVPIQSGSYKSSGQKKQYRLAPNKFQNLTNQFQADSHVTSSTYNSGSSVSSHESRGSKSSRGTSAQQRFSIRQCNIQDPVDANNNLGISVTKSNLAAITKALKCGHQHLENLLNDYKVMTEARLAEASIATHGSSGLSETLSTPSSMANNNENFYQNSMESRMYLQNQYENSGLINGVPVRIHAIPVDEVIFENSRKGKRSQSFDSEKERPIRSRDVARLLNPVPPENLGFVGGTITSNPVVIPVSRFDQNSDASTITTPKSTSTSFVTTPRGQSESGVHTEFDSTNSQRIQNLNYITQSHIGPTFESNLLNGSSVAADQPWFLQAFFSTSCWHYMRKNTSVRCDLLDHPMQSCLSTPSVLSRGIAEENSDRPIPQDPDQRYLQFKSDVDPFVTDTARLWKAYQTAIVIRNRVCDGDFEIIGKRKSNYEDSRAKDSLIIADYAVESGVNSADISMDMESVTSIIEEPRKNDISDIVALKSKYHDLETDQSVCNPAEDTSLPQPVYTAAIPLLEPALTSRTASSPIARMDDPACDSSVITTSTAGSSSGKKSQSKPSKGRKNSKRYSLSNAVANSTAAVHLHDCKSPEGKVEHDAQSSSNGSALVEDEHSSTEEDDDDVLGKVNELMVVIYRRVKKGFNVASLCHNFDLSQLPLSARKFAKSSRKYKFSKKGFAKMISKVNISTISTALCAVALVVIVGYSLYHKTYGKSNQETIITSPNILYVNSKNLKDKNIEGGFRPAAIYSPNLFVDETDPEEIGEEIAYLNDYCNEVGSNPRSSRRVCTAKSVLYEESVDYSPGAEVNKVISVAGNSVASASFDYDNSSKASSKNKINKGSKLSHLMQPVTHWVKLGGSISFGDFSKYGSYSSKLGETEDYPEVSYQWTKDGANVSDHNIRSLSPHAQHYVNEFASDPRQKPYFTIRKSKLSDAGHYKCYKYAGNERYLIAETIIQISSKWKFAVATFPFDIFHSPYLTYHYSRC